MNISSPQALRECTSCQICAAVCSHNAITIRLNEDGFYRPYIDVEKCTDCGLCVKSCYKFDENIKITPSECIDNRVDVYSAQSLSEKVLEKVTSGGVADALAKDLVKQGYVCIGVIYNDDKHRAEHTIASTELETNSFRGSKYIQAYSVDAFKELVKNVRTTKYAVFGLPCHIYAIHQYLSFRKLRDNAILIDLFCHGCPSMLIWNKYEMNIKHQVYNKKFDEVQFRSKIRGWGNFNVAVVIDNVTAFVSNPKQDEFYSLFFSDHVLNDSCSNCKLRSTMEYTDIRLGDFWGREYVNDRKGVSAVAITSERGKVIFNNIRHLFVIEKKKMSDAIVAQSYGKVYSPNISLRNEMLNVLRDNKKTLKDVVSLYYSKQGISIKAKRLLKQINWYLPFDLVRFLKRLK